MRFSHKSGTRPLDGYTIKRGVGIGGFGEVYFAISDAGKEVALKCIQRNLDVEVRGVSQCLNLKHPHLVDLYDLKYDAEGQAWVVMEYVPGDNNLKEVIDRNPNGLPRTEAERLFRAIADGVAYLHDHGIVHRDLKPGNIFDDGGVIKIGDYGLSKFISASRRSGQTESVGTFHYMAPEIGKGVYGKEIDIYALGIILYEMLTGGVPFDGETSQEIIMKHLTDNPDLTRVPEPYRTVVQKALRKDPEKRYRTVQQMLDGLKDAAAPAEPPILLQDIHLRDEPFYIGDEEKPEAVSEMVFGTVRHREVVCAEVVPPAGDTPFASVASRRNVRMAAARRPARPAPAAALPTGAVWSSVASVVVVFAVILLLAAQPLLLPFVVLIALGFFGWRLGRSLLARRRAVTGSRTERRDPRDPVWRAEVRQVIRNKLISERFAELTGSMMLSAIAAALLILVALLWQGNVLDGSVTGWSIFAWLTVTSITGCWVLLTLGKFWEGDEGDHFLRRLVMLVAGVAVGAVAFGAAEGLMVNLPNLDRWTAHSFSRDQLVGRIYSPDGAPLVAAYLIYFAGLFAILRWWAQTDPLRPVRISLFATAVCVLWAWIMHMFCQFPQPWGLMLAATISVATQLAAPWVNPRQSMNRLGASP